MLRYIFLYINYDKLNSEYYEFINNKLRLTTIVWENKLEKLEVYIIGDEWDNIVDEDLELLRGIHILKLETNKNITDEGIEKSAGIHTLNLNYNEKITDRGIKYLKSCNYAYINSIEYHNL